MVRGGACVACAYVCVFACTCTHIFFQWASVNVCHMPVCMPVLIRLCSCSCVCVCVCICIFLVRVC